MLISGPLLLLKALKFPGNFPQEKEILHTHTLHTPHFAGLDNTPGYEKYLV
jgi:hypothetical protein